MPFLKRIFSRRTTDQDTSRPAPIEKTPPIKVIDYSEARNKAIAWLGDRYLLAKPIARIDLAHNAQEQDAANSANLQRA